MTSKFKIFCDDPQTTEKDLPSKREPLALKQHFVHRPQLKLQDHQPQAHSQASSQELGTLQPPPPPPPPSSQSSSSPDQDQDQENDISIASLGSDFVPSIVHEHFDSFECEEEANITATSVNTESECQHDDCAIDGDYNYDDHRISLTTDDDDDDVDLDEETQLELSLALKKHDESALLNCAVFQNDIIDYLQELELDSELRPIANYMVFHHDIDSNKRSILINWLVEVTDEYELQTETLFICTNIIDRFLSRMSISTSHFQLLGVAAMFIATKYEEIYPPYLSQFVEVTDETFSGKQIIQMEQEILRTLDFRISMPTITFFLRQIFAYNKFTKKVYNLAEYLCYLSLLADQPFLEYYPSEIALAAVILAAHQLDAAASISTELKSSYDKSNQSQVNRRDAFYSPSSNNSTSNNGSGKRQNVNKELPFCIESLRAMQERVPHDSAVYIKFSSATHDRVALLPPLKVEDLYRCA